MSAVPDSGLLKRAADARARKNWTEAVRLYDDHLKTHADDADSICWRAYSLWQKGDLDAAIAGYRKGAELAPDWSGIHNCLGSIYRRQRRSDEAIAEYRAAAKMSPYFAEAHANLAEMLWDQGKLAEATVHYRQAIEGKTDWAEIYDGLARVLIEQGLLAQANLAAREAVRLLPERAAHHITLSNALSRMDKHVEAEAILKALLDATPEDASLWSRLSWARWKAKRYDDAKTAAQEALWRDATLPYPHFLLGWIAARSEEKGSAIAHYKRYLELDPEDAEGATLALSNLGAAPAPDKAPLSYVKQIYAGRSPYWDTNVTGKTRYRAPHQIADALEHFMGPREGLDIMDVGCGTGLEGPLVRARARRLDGLDLSAHMIEKAREKGVYDELIEGDLETVLYARPAQYDVLTSAATLIHFGDLEAPLKASAAALRPGGWMAFTVFPNTEKDGIGVLPFFCHSHSPEHIRDRAARAGFDVISIEEHTHEYHDDKPVPGLVVVLRLRDRTAA